MSSSRQLMVKVELPNHEERWYRLSPKLFNALITEYKLKGSHKKLRSFAYEEFHDVLINVPLTRYYFGHKAIIVVSKVLYFRFRYISKSSELCTRSQFIKPKNAKKHILRAFKYMRHDYGWYSRLNILCNLIAWTK